MATGTGARTRLDSASLKPAPLNQADWSRIAALTGDGRPVREAGLIASGDHYYFSHHDEVSLPAYRIVFDDAERSRYYFDPVSGDLRQKFDRDRRWNRWLFHGLHRFDFTPAMRERPLWDVLVLGLMLGVTVASLSGVLLAWRRITRKSRST